MNTLDAVALLADIPERGLVRGQVGTVVELLDGGSCEVEFIDDAGRTYAQVSIRADVLLTLRCNPVKA